MAVHVTPPGEGPRPGSLESRASLALKFLAVVSVFAMVLATIPGSIPSSRFLVVAFHLGSLALAVLYVLVAWALDRRQPWAVAAIRPLLVLLVVWGAYTFVSALLAGAARIPFTALAAAWALLGAADRRPLPRLSGRGGAVLVSSAALIAILVASQSLFGWGGYFDVHEPDLSASMAVDCEAPGAALPDSIEIGYEWSWSNITLLANDEDVILIGWNGDDADGHPLYVLDDAPDAGDGIHLGASSGVSGAMADEAALQWRSSSMWRIELSTGGIRSGRVELVLRRAAEQPPEPQPLTVGASYIHVGVWRNDAPTVTCSW
jgi:hypothetical protein